MPLLSLLLCLPLPMCLLPPPLRACARVRARACVCVRVRACACSTARHGTDTGQKSEIAEAMHAIDPCVDVNRIFSRIVHKGAQLPAGESVVGKLVGVLCYYGQHWVAIFWDGALGCWVRFDDANVRKLGATWNSAGTHY